MKFLPVFQDYSIFLDNVPEKNSSLSKLCTNKFILYF